MKRLTTTKPQNQRKEKEIRPIVLSRHVEVVAKVAYYAILNHPNNAMNEESVLDLLNKWTYEFFVGRNDVFEFNNDNELEEFAKKKLDEFIETILDPQGEFDVKIRIEHVFSFKVHSKESEITEIADDAANELLKKVMAFDIDAKGAKHKVELSRITIV